MTFTDMQPLFPDRRSDGPVIIAGPCSAESLPQVLSTAQALADAGIEYFRAGVWKPRTKPGGFEGIGSAALPWLAEVQRQTGMKATTEVATARHLDEALKAGITVVWIGARTSANPFAVQEIADALAALPDETRESLSVLVKNPVNPDLELWIGALERIYRAGIRRLGAIHRGFSSYGKQLYRNPPMWRIPIELRRRVPGLPIICDPSHIAGSRDLVPHLCQQALAMNFDGLIIESHCNPDAALSDAAQQLTPEALIDMLASLETRANEAESEHLGELRRQIDSLDDELLEILAKRMSIAREIGRYKREKRISVIQPVRYNDLMQRRVDHGASLDLSPDFVRNILAAIHEESVRQQIQLK